MRQKMLIALAWGVVASVALVLAWPLAFAGVDDPPGRRPAPGDKEPPPPPPPPPPPLDKAVENLDLTPAQKAKVDRIVKAHHVKMRRLMDKAREDLLKQMKGTLPREQYEKFEQAMRRPGPSGPPDGPPGRGPDDKDRPGKRPPPGRE